MWCRLAHFKLRAHFLDLRGLFLELGRENFHLFLQLFNFAIEFGLGLAAGCDGAVADHVILIDTYWVGGTGVAGRLIPDLADITGIT